MLCPFGFHLKAVRNENQTIVFQTVTIKVIITLVWLYSTSTFSITCHKESSVIPSHCRVLMNSISLTFSSTLRLQVSFLPQLQLVVLPELDYQGNVATYPKDVSLCSLAKEELRADPR